MFYRRIIRPKDYDKSSIGNLYKAKQKHIDMYVLAYFFYTNQKLIFLIKHSKLPMFSMYKFNILGANFTKVDISIKYVWI